MPSLSRACRHSRVACPATGVRLAFTAVRGALNTTSERQRRRRAPRPVPAGCPGGHAATPPAAAAPQEQDSPRSGGGTRRGKGEGRGGGTGERSALPFSLAQSSAFGPGRLPVRPTGRPHPIRNTRVCPCLWAQSIQLVSVGFRGK